MSQFDPHGTVLGQLLAAKVRLESITDSLGASLSLAGDHGRKPVLDVKERPPCARFPIKSGASVRLRLEVFRRSRLGTNADANALLRRVVDRVELSAHRASIQRAQIYQITH